MPGQTNINPVRHSKPDHTPFTVDQEIVNSLIHMFGILFGVVCVPVLIVLAAKSERPSIVAGVAVYGFSFLMLFTFSALYHSFQQIRVKRVLEIIDHISIYFLIAGTYTPFLLIYLRDTFGITLLVTLWTLTVLGIFFKILYTGRFDKVSVIIYLAMGWILLAGGKRFFTALPSNVLTYIFIGGALYSLGIVFYLWRGFRWHHAVWHFLVLAAAIAHYLAVLLSL